MHKRIFSLLQIEYASLITFEWRTMEKTSTMKMNKHFITFVTKTMFFYDKIDVIDIFEHYNVQKLMTILLLIIQIQNFFFRIDSHIADTSD